MAMLCPKCGVRIVSTKILESHLKKTHNTTIDVVQKENAMAEDQAQVNETQETTPVVPAAEETQQPGEGTQTPNPQVDGKRGKGKSKVADHVDAPITEPVVEQPEPEVIIRSADPRQLECSIGHYNWKGREISVPVSLEGEVRRILLDGGFYLKD